MSKNTLWVLVATVGSLMNITGASASSGTELAVIPIPAEMVREKQVAPFVLTARTQILAEQDNSEVQAVAQYLAELLAAETRLELVVADAGNGGTNVAAITLTTAGADASLGEEGYTLSVGSDGVRLVAPKSCGLFRGVQTLRQLLPLRPRGVGGRSGRVEAAFEISAVRIKDMPRYQWRGMMLDCCRHFMSKDLVKRYIDLLAYHKMNVLHWHLTEDQGWRIEIKKYPKLTEVGAFRDQDGKRYGGFYTQEDVKEIVAYAASRYITVVPEIEMPGHSRAALAAYPELSCTGGPFEVANTWGIFEDVYCAGNDATFTFLEGVLAEVIELFPSEFIHIGGDECPKARWKECPKCQARIKAEALADEHELQSYFVRRAERFLNSKGRRLVGWDEILEGGLAPNATVQSWRGMKGAVAAAKAGHDVVSSPTSHCYLDYPHEQNLSMPRWMAVTSLEKAYTFEATPPELTADEAKHILGGECNIWTERVPQDRLDHQVFPRLCAIAESLWTPADRREWGDFSRRMETHYKRLDAMGVTYYIPMPRIESPSVVFMDSVEVKLTNPAEDGRIHYTLDGSDPDAFSQVYQKPLRIDSTTTIRARVMLPTGNASDMSILELSKQSAREPEQVESAKPGLSYVYYEGSWKALPEFASLSPVATGVTEGFDLEMRKREEDFAVTFDGFVSVPADGLYAFYVNSDDGAQLRVGDAVVVNHDGLHGPTELRGQIILKAGRHPLHLSYFQYRGRHKLNVEYDGPGIKRQPIPNAALEH